MRVRELLAEWQKSTQGEKKDQTFQVKLTRQEKAKIAALTDMYPGKTQEDIVRDLVAAALAELEASIPYIPGPRVVSEDELGDPIFEDIGPMPRFRALTRQHLDETEA